MKTKIRVYHIVTWPGWLTVDVLKTGRFLCHKSATMVEDSLVVFAEWLHEK